MEQDNTDRLRVLLVGHPGLLVQGLYDILGHEHRIEILGPFAVIDDTLSGIENLQPDVVVITGESLSNAILLSHLLRAFPRLSIITIDLQEDNVYVYRSERLTATSVNLLEAIQHLDSKGCLPVPAEN